MCVVPGRVVYLPLDSIVAWVVTISHEFLYGFLFLTMDADGKIVVRDLRGVGIHER